LQEIAQIYLTAVAPQLVHKWKAALSDMVPIRPPDEELEEGYKLLSELFDHVWRLPLFRQLKKTPTDSEQVFLEKWREFPRYTRTGALIEGTGGFKGHLLLRPLGQIILAKAVGDLAATKKSGGLGIPLESIFKKLARYDKNDGFSAHRPSCVWWGVTYTPTTNRILNRGKSWAHKLLVQLLAGIEDEEEAKELWQEFVYARGVNLDENTWKNLDGRVARFDWDKVELPKPLRG
jgi:hypothetical protein